MFAVVEGGISRKLGSGAQGVPPLAVLRILSPERLLLAGDSMCS